MNKTAGSNELSILFLSCDKYEDLWEPLFYCVEKYFHQHIYPVYLGSNTKSYKNTKVKTLLSGSDRDWSTSFLTILGQITTPYILLLLDDIFPIDKVNISGITQGIGFMKRYSASHIHIVPQPKPDRVIEHGVLGFYERGAPYRVNALGFWNIETLKKILLPGESAWNFEIMGSYRSSFSDGYYCLTKPLFKRLHVVEKGKIFRDAYEYCAKHSIPLTIEHRKILENKSFFISEIQKKYFNMVSLIPWRMRLSLMNMFRKLIISY